MQENLTIHNLFEKIAMQYQQKVALQIKKDNFWQKITYKELRSSALKIANFLIKDGFKKQDFAILLLENCPQWPIIYLGIMYAGLICVPLDTQLSSEEIKNIILDCDAKIMFCSYKIFSDKINKEIQKLFKKIVVLENKDVINKRIVDFSKLERIVEDIKSLPETLDSDIASLIYTSGTTAKPKAVMLTHRNICSNFLSIKELNLCFSYDNFLSILPLHHTYPFMGNLIVPLLMGATVTYPPLEFRFSQLADIIKQASITILIGVPKLFLLLHNAIFEKVKKFPKFLIPFYFIVIRKKISKKFGKTLRYLVSGGAKLEPKIAINLTKLGFKIIEGYGLTETSPIVTLNPPQKVKFGSAGKPIPNVEVKIFNPKHSREGEILIKGPNVMKGYFKNQELTAKVLKDGWFYSGDLGYIDEDGYLFITGREKEVVILDSGKTIYPDDLEAYYKRIPYIKEICILQRSEEKFGHLTETLFAVIVPDLEYFQKKNVKNIRAKIRWEIENLSKQLPDYKHIMGFILTTEPLSCTTLGKIKRYEVREKYLNKADFLEIEKPFLSEEDKKILNEEFVQKIMSYLTREVKRPVYLDSHLEIDLGIDSLSRVELSLGLEALLSLKIPDEALYGVSTVRELIIKIQEIIKKTKPNKLKIEQKNWTEILKEKPKEEILQKIRIKPRIIDWILTYIFKSLFLFIFRIFWFLRIKKVKNLPESGPYLICPNHASFLDGFIIFSSLPLKLAINTYFVGFNYIFEYPLFKWSLKSARLVPINPDINLISTMQIVSYLFSHKKIVCIFPEGMRSVDENIKEFKKGVGILIKELNIPVIPTYIKGSHRSWPRTSFLPRLYPLKVIFGRLFFKEDLLKQAKEPLLDYYESIAHSLREEVIKLSFEKN